MKPSQEVPHQKHLLIWIPGFELVLLLMLLLLCIFNIVTAWTWLSAASGLEEANTFNFPFL